jgi:hypothetical protein
VVPRLDLTGGERCEWVSQTQLPGPARLVPGPAAEQRGYRVDND